MDLKEDRLAFAAGELGLSTYKFDTAKSVEENAEELAAQHDLPEGVDVVVEATGVVLCIQTGIALARRGGSYVQVGLRKKIIDFPMVVMSEKELTVRGSFRYGFGDFTLASSLARRGKIIDPTTSFFLSISDGMQRQAPAVAECRKFAHAMSNAYDTKSYTRASFVNPSAVC